MIHSARRIEMWETSKLKPYDRNARTHSDAQVDQIAASIKEFGFTNPILVDSTEGIIAGHGRLAAAQLLKLKQVPVIVLDHLSEKQKRAYILADNKLALNAGWDQAILASELEALSLDGFDLDLIGFSEEELAEIMPDVEQVEPQGDEDEAPAPAAEPKVVKGEIYHLGSHRLMCGDSTVVTDIERLMAGKKADLVFTDPPYGVDYQGGHNEKKRKGIKNDALEGESLTDLFADSLTMACAFSHEHSAFYIWYANGKAVETFASFATLPLKVRAVLCWYKVKSGLGAFMSQYIPNYEPCIYAFKDGCSPQWFGPSDEKTVWELKKERVNEFHPTQKPVELPERAITNSSKTGQIVLDVFGGSGSTLIAAEKLKRKAYVMELDPIYCGVILDRWQKFSGKKAKREDGTLWDEIKGEE